MSSPRVWFITGSSTGFGKLIAQLALKNGDRVVATLRKPEVLSDLSAQYSADQLLILKLDVTKIADVTTVFSKAIEVFGRIDIVVNNAGYGIVSEIEGTPDENARDLFEVLFWGAVAVTKEAIKTFREINKPAGGKLLQISSMFGVIGAPGAAYYSAAKFALDGLSEALALEILPEWNIKISCICPAWFRTPMVTSNAVQLPQHPAYTDASSTTSQMRKGFQTMVDGTNPALGDPEKLVKAIFEIVDAPDNLLRIPLGQDAVDIFNAKSANLKAEAAKYEHYSSQFKFD